VKINFEKIATGSDFQHVVDLFNISKETLKLLLSVDDETLECCLQEGIPPFINTSKLSSFIALQ
jgi:hypothetical protein